MPSAFIYFDFSVLIPVFARDFELSVFSSKSILVVTLYKRVVFLSHHLRLF